MLAVMISQCLMFAACWLMPSSESPFQQCLSGFQMSLILEHPARAKALPSLLPLTSSGVPLALRMDGLPKIGCLRISSSVVGSLFVKPCLAFIQASTMLLHIERLSRLSLGAARSQLKSGVDGPFPWRSSLVRPALFQTNSFQGSPPGARPLTSSFARSASN
jgi:hypothetical protein